MEFVLVIQSLHGLGVKKGNNKISGTSGILTISSVLWILHVHHEVLMLNYPQIILFTDDAKRWHDLKLALKPFLSSVEFSLRPLILST